MLSWALPASACPGGGGILGCVPAPCAPGLRCWIRAPAPPPPLRSRPEPPRAAPAPQPPPRSRRQSPSELLPCQCVHVLQPFRELGRGVWRTLPGAQVSVSVPGSLRASPPLLGSCSNSLQAPFRLGRLVKLLLLRDGGFLSWGHSPWPQPGSSLGPSPWMLFYFFFFFSSIFLP